MTSDETSTVAPIVRTLPGPARYLCGLTWDGRQLWHSDQEAERIFAIDPADGSVLRELACAGVRADLAFDGSLLCQVGGRPKRILLIDPVTGQASGERAVLPSSGRLTGIEFGPDGVWLLLREPTVVQLRDYPDLRVLREYPVPGESPSGLTYADGVLVHGDFADAVLHATDPATGRALGTVGLSGHPTGLTWDGTHLWYCDFGARAFRAISLSALSLGSVRG